MKTEIINARIEPGLKRSAEAIFRGLGMSTTDAISIFLSQVVLNKGLPFPVRIPNKATRQAMKEARSGKGTVYKGSTKDMLDAILK